MFTLSSRHQSHFLSALNNIRAPSLSYQPTVLKISFIAWETMGEVMKCYQTQPPYSSASKFTFKFHAICSPKYSMSVEPTLHKFTFVSNILKCNNQLLMSGWNFQQPTLLRLETTCILILNTLHPRRLHHIVCHLEGEDGQVRVFALFDSNRQCIWFHHHICNRHILQLLVL